MILLALILTSCGNNSKIKGISEKEAIRIALSEQNLNESDVEVLRSQKENLDNEYAYRITYEFEDRAYEYSIGSDGQVYSSERHKINAKDNQEIVESNNDGFTEEDALAKALEHAKVSQEEAMLLKIERDYDDYDYSFDVEFRTATRNYEYEISSNGDVLDFESEYYTDNNIVYTRPTYYYSGATRYYYSGATPYVDPGSMISEEKAIEIVANHSGVSVDAMVITKMKRKSNRIDIDFASGDYRYQYEISGNGTVLKSKKKLR